MHPTVCVRCKDPLNGSWEHVFPQALGGTKQSEFLYCSECNKWLGKEIDEKLAKELEWVTTMLAVQRDRKSAPTLRRVTQDGQQIYLAPGGVPSARGPSPPEIVDHETQEGQKTVRITVPIEQANLGEHLLTKALKDLKVDRSAVKSTQISLLRTPVGEMQEELGVGGEDQFRAAAKIACGFLALEVGDNFLDDQYAPLRQAAMTKQGNIDGLVWLTPALRNVDPAFPSDGAQHKVIVYLAENGTWARVEIYDTFSFNVHLSKQLNWAFRAPLVWLQNPTKGTWSESRNATIQMPAPVCAHRSAFKQQMGELRAVINRRGIEIAIENVITEEIAIAEACHPDGALTEEEVHPLSIRIGERIADILHTNQDSCSSRLIPSDVLTAVVNALRPKKRK